MSKKYTDKKLLELWKELGDTPVDEEYGDTLDADFLHFKKGDDVSDVWYWFEEQSDNFVVGEVMYGNYDSLKL